MTKPLSTVKIPQGMDCREPGQIAPWDRETPEEQQARIEMQRKLLGDMSASQNIFCNVGQMHGQQPLSQSANLLRGVGWPF